MAQSETGTSNAGVINPGGKTRIYNAGQLSLMNNTGWRPTKIAKAHRCCSCVKTSPVGSAMWRREWASKERRHNYEYACELCHILYSIQSGVDPTPVTRDKFYDLGDTKVEKSLWPAFVRSVLLAVGLVGLLFLLDYLFRKFDVQL